MSITILEPSSDQEVTSPVTVVAAYLFANTFDLTCKVGSVPSPSPEPSPGSPDNTHPACLLRPAGRLHRGRGRDNLRRGDASPT